MSESLYCAVCLILCLTGLFSVLWHLFCRLVCEKDCDEIYTVICTKDMSGLPDKVYSALILTKYRPLGARGVYVVDCGIPSYIKQYCENSAHGIGRVHFITQDRIADIFENKD